VFSNRKRLRAELGDEAMRDDGVSANSLRMQKNEKGYCRSRSKEPETKKTQ
jgi:hypothetical protein